MIGMIDWDDWGADDDGEEDGDGEDGDGEDGGDDGEEDGDGEDGGDDGEEDGDGEDGGDDEPFVPFEPFGDDYIQEDYAHEYAEWAALAYDTSTNPKAAA